MLAPGQSRRNDACRPPARIAADPVVRIAETRRYDADSRCDSDRLRQLIPVAPCRDLPHVMHGCWETFEARLEAVTSPPSPSGDLSLGHILQAVGLADLGEVIVLRHTIRPKDPASLREPVVASRGSARIPCEELRRRRTTRGQANRAGHPWVTRPESVSGEPISSMTSETAG